jgi:hypothetical protein
MSAEYYDLFDLLEQDIESGDYYSELPLYVQEMIEDRADSVRTFEDLKNYAEDFLNGEK